MNQFLKVLFFLFIPTLGLTQKNADGIYLQVEEERCYYSKLRLANTKTNLCVLDNPLISSEYYREVGALKENAATGIRQFSIILSPEGKKKLAILSEIYAGKNFAFVMDDEVICLMAVVGKISSGKFTVTEKIHHSSLKAVRTKVEAELAK